MGMFPVLRKANLPRLSNISSWRRQITLGIIFLFITHVQILFQFFGLTILHHQIKVCWWLAIFHSCPSSTQALEQIALKD
jgi:hypothetical protein